MFRRSKGIVGEELFATLIVIVLIFVFVFSIVGIYNKYIGGQQFLYNERVASSIAERIYFDNNGVIAEGSCESILSKYGFQNITKTITYYKDGQKTCSSGILTAQVSKSVASLPLLVTDGKFYPAVLIVEVGV